VRARLRWTPRRGRLSRCPEAFAGTTIRGDGRGSCSLRRVRWRHGTKFLRKAPLLPQPGRARRRTRGEMRRHGRHDPARSFGEPSALALSEAGARSSCCDFSIPRNSPGVYISNISRRVAIPIGSEMSRSWLRRFDRSVSASDFRRFFELKFPRALRPLSCSALGLAPEAQPSPSPELSRGGPRGRARRLRRNAEPPLLACQGSRGPHRGGSRKQRPREGED